MSSKSVKNLVPKLESFHVTPQLLLSRQKLPKHSFIWDQRDCDYYISRTIRVASCCWLLASCCLVTSLSDQDVIQGSLAGVTCLAGLAWWQQEIWSSLTWGLPLVTFLPRLYPTHCHRQCGLAFASVTLFVSVEILNQTKFSPNSVLLRSSFQCCDLLDNFGG